MPDDASITTAPETEPAPILDDAPPEPEPEPEPEPAPMPDDAPPAPGPDAAPADRSADAAPDPDRLELISAPAVLRRAPKFGAFVRAGVLTGAVVGILLAGLVRAPSGGNRSAAIVFTALGLACLGALLGAGAAVVADRRSTHR